MKLGINTLFILKYDFEEALRYAKNLGAGCIEVASMGEASKKHCDPASSLPTAASCAAGSTPSPGTGSKSAPFPPTATCSHLTGRAAAEWARGFRTACELAELAGVEPDHPQFRVPGRGRGGHRSLLDHRRLQRRIPRHSQVAVGGAGDPVLARAGEDRHRPRLPPLHRALDRRRRAHPPATLMKLRDAVGGAIGCNFDPSHLFVHARRRARIDPFPRRPDLAQST